jgi:uncharacterized protein with FMN-binding domain
MPIFFAIAVLIIAIVAGTFFLNDAPEPEVAGNTSGSAPETAPTTEVVAEYADGTYTVSTAYISPAGEEKIDVSVTIAQDVITAATFTGYAENPASIRNQQKFAQAYDAAVVGKNIDELSLSVVNGASLTTRGFNDALTQVRDQARI